MVQPGAVSTSRGRQLATSRRGCCSYLGPRGPLAGPSIFCDCRLWCGRAGKEIKQRPSQRGHARALPLSRTSPARAAPVPPRALFARPCLSGERWRAVPPSRVPSAQHAQPHPAQGRGRLECVWRGREAWCAARMVRRWRGIRGARNPRGHPLQARQRTALRGGGLGIHRLACGG